MDLSASVVSLLSTLDAMSGGSLARREDLGVLLELGSDPGKRPVLDELGFYAKFLHRTYGIMTRIGKDGEGYQRLQQEFTTTLQKASGLLDTLLRDAPEEETRRFHTAYGVLSTSTMENLLALFHDLSWYKNWLLDAREDRKDGR